jgi:hypothetical protein
MTLKMTSLQQGGGQGLVKVAAIIGLTWASCGAWGQAVTPRPEVLKSLKGLALNTPREAVLTAIDQMQLGMPTKCYDRLEGEQNCLVGPIPQSAGFTLARERVHYVDVRFNSKGALIQIILTMGVEGSPARSRAFGELGETLQAAIGRRPDVHSSTYEDVILRWKGDDSEVLLGTTPLQKGVAIQAYLRTLNRDAFKTNSRSAERFVNDL